MSIGVIYSEELNRRSGNLYPRGENEPVIDKWRRLDRFDTAVCGEHTELANQLFPEATVPMATRRTVIVFCAVWKTTEKEGYHTHKTQQWVGETSL